MMPNVSQVPTGMGRNGQKTAKFGQKLAFLAKYGHFWQNIGIFGPFDPMPDQNLMRTRCQGAFFCYVGTKTLGILANKRQNFAQNMLSWAHIGLAGSFGALLVWLEVVARGLYLARPIYFIELIMRMLIGRIFGSIIKVKICLLHQELL